MKRFGLRQRILLAALAPAVLVALLVTGLLASEQLKRAAEEQHRRLSAVARQLSASAEHSLFVGDREMLLRLLESALPERDVIAAAFLDGQGRVLASTLPPERLPAVETAFVGWSASALDEPRVHWHLIDIWPTSYGEADLFMSDVAVPVLPLGRLMLQISNQSLLDEVRQQTSQAAGIAIVALLFGILLALGLAHGLLRTLGEIGRVVAGITHGRLEVRVAPFACEEQGELGELARGINTMAAAVGQTQEELKRRIEEATASLRAERDAAERAARARSRFFAAASHDLRQPVQALALFVERLRHDAKGSALLPKIKQLARTVETLQSLLDSLLDYSRLASQAYSIQRQPVQASVAIGTVLDEFSPLADKRGIALRRHLNECWLDTDPVLLYRLLINLIGNAIRHTRHGAVLVACRRRGEKVRIEVWDTGPGIAPEQQAAIFEELVQLNNPERDANKGLGLGLAIVKRISELLDHPIELCSRLGHGSRFAVTIPLAPAPPAALVAHEEFADSAEVDLLVVGEASTERDALLELISTWGHARAQALLPSEALAWVARHGAPALTVYETAGDLAAAEALLDRIDTVACTSVPALLIHPGPLRPGAVHGRRRLLLPRPFRPARLRALLDHLLGRAEPSADPA
ncbi:MAG: ATP-binding protein [Rhodocyclaceae bacterium]|nr:ATP-binding protein [Rhodocyclaceae bacterium]